MVSSGDMGVGKGNRANLKGGVLLPIPGYPFPILVTFKKLKPKER
ncbi:MAG: hypothetical protein ABGW77_00900 [Campylobacterales bacterium]